jgi:hypothetical protein
MEFRDDTGVVRELRGTLMGVVGADAVAIEVAGKESTVPRDRIVLMRQDVTLASRKRKGA